MIKTKVSINLNEINEKIKNDYGIGSEGQRKWSEIVFDGIEPYLPGQPKLPRASRESSEKVFDQGEIIYTSGTEPDWARFMYHGKVMEDPVTKSAFARPGVSKVLRRPEQELIFTNPKATPYWEKTAKDTHLEEWIKDFQTWIKNN